MHQPKYCDKNSKNISQIFAHWKIGTVQNLKEYIGQSLVMKIVNSENITFIKVQAD